MGYRENPGVTKISVDMLQNYASDNLPKVKLNVQF